VLRPLQESSEVSGRLVFFLSHFFTFMLLHPPQHAGESLVRDSRIPLVRYDRMDSHSDMSDFLVILTKCDEYESSISYCTSDSPPTLSPPSWSSDYSKEDEFGVVETLYCQCYNVDALVECLSYGSLFELDSFYPGC
jgi:hypothetical protein